MWRLPVVGQFGPPEPMVRTKPPMGPWQNITIDLMSPMPTGGTLLVVVDYYAFNYNSKGDRLSVTNLCEIWFSTLFKVWQWYSISIGRFLKIPTTKWNRIYCRKSPALWPQANREVERQNRTLLKALKEAEEKKWQEELPKFLLAYCTTPQVSTGATLAYLMFGRELKTKLAELRRQAADKRDWR